MKPTIRWIDWARLLALGALMALVACSPSRTEQDHLTAAEGLLAKRDAAAAVIEIKNALQLNPQSAAARFLLARALLAQEDPAGAEVELTKAVDEGYRSDEVALLRARLWNTLGRFVVTVQEFSSHSLAEPQQAAAMEVQLAIAQVGLRQWSEATQHVQRALAKVPGYEPARVLAVRLEAAQGRRDAALAQAQRLTTDVPGSAEAWKLLGDVYRARDGGSAQAVSAYEKALSLDAMHPEALTALTELSFDRNDLAAAQRQVATLRKVAANRPSTLLYEARLAAAGKDFDRARQILDGLLKVSPDDPRFLQAAGAVAAASGRPSDAETLLSKVLRTVPENLSARQLLAQVFIDDGRFAQAAALLEPVISGGQADASTLALAARANQALGQGGRATQQLMQAATKPGAGADLRVEAALAGAASGAPLDTARLAGIAAQDAAPQADVKLIDALLQRKQFAEALQAVSALDKKTPKSAVPPTLKGRVQWMAGQREAARRAFAEALARDPLHFPALANLAAMDVEDRKLDEARRRFDGLLAAEPGHLQALLTLADLERMAGQPAARVRERLLAAVKANPRAAEAHLALVDHDLRQGDAAAALDSAQAANATLPHTVPILVQLGRVQLMRGQFEPARSSFGAALSLDAKHLGARLGMADALMSLGNLQAARDALDRAIADAPASAEALRAAANLALRDKQYGKVVQYARRIQELRPQEPAGFLMEGQAELLRGGYPAAVQAFAAVLKLGDNADAAAGMHRALVGAKRQAEAEAFAQSWSTKHPQDGGFILKAAETAIANRDLAAAERLYRQLADRQPRNAVALNNLAMMLIEQGKPGAVGFAQKAVALSPQQTAFSDTLAQAYAAEKDYAKAIEVQRKLVEREPQAPDLRLQLARLFIAAGDADSARRELLELKKLGTAYPRLAEVSKLLQQL